MNMKNILKNIKHWALVSKFRMIMISAMFVLVIGLPFILGITLISTIIKNETLYMIIDLIIFVCFVISYIFFTKYMNKL